MSRKGRRLSAEEEKLWKKVAETTTRLSPQSPFPKSERLRDEPKPPAAPRPIPAFRVGEKSALTNTATRIPPQKQPLRMDSKTFAHMKRGKRQPEARLDLHGMTTDHAHSALLAFLLRCHAEGKRLVLVITGKGKRSEDTGPIPRPTGVLRRQVPHWLDQPPLAQIVLQTAPAHQRHGGSGALYVYLRR